MKSNSRGVFWTILASFFVSGLAGLLYQVVWTRYLALFLGSTSYAVVAVLAAFMGGLAAGNALLGTRADSLRRPLFFYACLEAGIGLFAVFFPWYFEAVQQGFLSVIRTVHPEGTPRLALQFGFAVLIILLPTVLMGATLPVLTKYVTRSLSELRGRVAALYSINSAGAVAGILLADWWWIPALGLEAVVQLGATLSLGIALVAYVLSSRSGEGLDEPAQPVARSATDESFTPLECRVALVAAGLSGFVAMLYEVAWTRLLALALGSSTHAYSLMLATFISGIAVGSALVSSWRRRYDTLVAFAVAEWALAGTLLVSMFFYDLIPYAFAHLADVIARRPAAYPLYELVQALICFSVLFVPAVCLGMTLPLASRVVTADFRTTGGSVGRVFAVNTVGTVLGAVLTGLVFLPVLGLASTLALGIGINALIGWVTLASRRGGVTRALIQGLVATAVLVAVVSLTLGERWSRAFVLGLWRDVRPPASIAEFRQRADIYNLAYHRDGAGSTVAILAVTNRAGQPSISLKVNGKADASSGEDMSTQILAGQLPMLLHPSAERVLVVGAGSGVTVGSILQHTTVKAVDLVEISPEVTEVAREHFAPFNHDALRNPRCHTHIEDAKTFLQTTPESFDIIVTEPSNPWMAGVAAVFSQEYYRDCLARLKPGGLCAQWIQAYETDDETFATVVATFGSVFPHLSLWQTSTSDLLLIGAPQPYRPDLQAMARRLAEPAVAADLKRIEITRPVNVLALQMVAFGDAFFLAPDGTTIHSDFHPVLEYRAQRAFFVRGMAMVPYRLNEVQRPRPRTLLGEHLAGAPIAAEDCRALARQFAKIGIPQLPIFRSVLRRWQELQPNDPTVLRLLSTYAIQNPAPDGEVASLVSHPAFSNEEQLGDLNLMRQLADLLLLQHRTRRSAFHLPDSVRLEVFLGALVQLDPARQRIHRMRLAEVSWDRGNDARARVLFEEALDLDEQRFGSLDFSEDPGCPAGMMARLIDADLRAGDLKGALEKVLRFGRLGYIRPERMTGDEVLQMLARRVIVTAQSSLQK
jgi:predicted membrane-bound spermidine synthase